MFTRISQGIGISRAILRFSSRSLSLFLLLLLLSGTLVAQSDLETKRADANRLFKEAVDLYQQGSKASLEMALQKLEQARPLFQSVNDRTGEASTLNNIGSVYDNLGEKQKALDNYAVSLPLTRAVGDRGGEATTLNNIGSVYSALGEKQKALDNYLLALPLYRAVGDRGGEAATLNHLGAVYYSLGEKQKALDNNVLALPLYRTVGDRGGEATTLTNIGAVCDDLGEKQKALDNYALALPLYRAAGDRGGEAKTLNNIGAAYAALGDKQRALDSCARALPLYRALGDRGGEAATLNHIGRVYDSLGEKQKALDNYALALPLNRAVGDRGGEATALNNIGAVYYSLGEKQKALDYYGQALPLSRAVADRRVEGSTLNNIGLVYDDLGEKQKALDNYALALPLYRADGDRGGEAATLTNIGSVYDDLGEKQKALDYYGQALPLRRAVGDRSGEATTLSNIGAVYSVLGEKQKALDYYGQALPLGRAVGDRSGEATTLSNIGAVYNALGEKQKALDYFEQALSLSQAVGNRSSEALQLYWIAVVYRDTGNPTKARARIEASLAVIESLRTKITNQELRSSYFATVQGYYEFYIDLLMRLHKQRPSEGYDQTALHASERARARALLETLAEANADIRQGVDSKLVERERALQQGLNVKAQEQMKLLSRPHTEEQARAFAQEIEALTAEFQQVETEIRQTSPRYAALTQPQPFTLKEIQTKVLDEDTLLLEYSLGAERSYLWAVTQQSITSYELPKRQIIEDTAREVYALLTDARKWESSATNVGGLGLDKANSPAPAAAPQRQLSVAHSPEALVRLSQMVLTPVAAQLGKRRLVVVADGALQFIPFAALSLESRVKSLESKDVTRQTTNSSANTDSRLPTRDSRLSTSDYTPLIVEHEIIMLPSASTLAVLRQEVKDRKPAAKTVAVLADPVFESNDKRVSQIRSGAAPGNVSPAVSPAPSRGAEDEVSLGLGRSAEDSGVRGRSLTRLPGTRDEAMRILSLVAKGDSMGALDFAATRQTAMSGELSQYRYVHFATHGFLNSLHPELSGIVLSMFDEQGRPLDGFLRAHEVFNLKLPAELVVLSACQTGLGKEIKGEGLVSLTRGFMYAGAPRVVVSLWSVSDQATAELMARFYRGMLEEKLRPAAALRAAQVSLMKEHGWESPFFWAAFTLQGEWR